MSEQALSGDKGSSDRSIVKVIYFDEQTASDYLDISAGGSAASTSEHVRTRANDMHGELETKVAAKLSWLPFMGASAEAAAGMSASSVGQSILSKTLSNTILTDYLEQSHDDERVRRLRNFQVTALKNSMAYMKMYTPYMLIARTEEHGIDLARMDEAFEKAKGYYELLAEETAGDGEKCVLRFNIRAFRNNYGLADLGRMGLVYHAFRVGTTTESGLNFNAEMAEGEADSAPITVQDAIDGVPAKAEPLLDVYDVVFAGVEHLG